jgi:hypothetical protein
MKENAQTEDDREAIRDFKEHMHTECKAMWLEFKKKDKKVCKAEWKKGEKSGRLIVRHVTIPNKSELPADTTMTKTWHLK